VNKKQIEITKSLVLCGYDIYPCISVCNMHFSRTENLSNTFQNIFITELKMQSLDRVAKPWWTWLPDGESHSSSRMTALLPSQVVIEIKSFELPHILIVIYSGEFTLFLHSMLPGSSELKQLWRPSCGNGLQNH